jgi:flavin-dependent dehydrogenase
MATESSQVLVIGGGPAGSTAATLLAQEGFSVTLLEREEFPRYHVGESLLPSCLPILDLMGARQKVDKFGFKLKRGAFFAWGSEQWELRFTELFGTEYSYQVRREDFDLILLRHAASQGVDTREGVSVKQINFEGGRAISADWERSDRSASGTILFDYVIDASGRAGLLATKQFNSRRIHEVFKNVAIWGYWRGAKTLQVGPEGAIGVSSIPKGWLWEIPLHDDTLSIGAVIGKDFLRTQQAAGLELDQIYRERIAESELISDLVSGAELVTELKAETDYSYVTDNFAGQGYLLAGDAACFLDPLLSTGVHLAMYSALLAAATVSSILRDGVPEANATRFYGKAYRAAYERLLVVVSLFYQAYRGRDEQFFEAQRLTRREQNNLQLHEAFLNVVTGIEDLADAQNEAFDMVAGTLSPDTGNPLAHHNSGMLQAPSTPGMAVDGLYLSTEPTLTLLRS